ncbi:distal tail protein Dit [Lysinibacillus sp. NPDC097279]|uniref:distal tail protein Dit n=1 Tax=Lysinibacillus sp. NPDC097279 TaxID=3364143 RepID=UPI003815E80C
MLESVHFMYDNISSKDMGVYIGWSSGNLFEENFLPQRRIIEKKIANNETPYFQRVEHDPLSFKLSFYLDDWVNEHDLRKIARWLFQPYYKPLVFDHNPNRVMYALVEGDSRLIHNGLKQGYVELAIRCDSPYSYSHEQILDKIEFRKSNKGYLLQDDITTFAEGQCHNMKITSNGLTIDELTNTWGILYANTLKWSDI